MRTKSLAILLFGALLVLDASALADDSDVGAAREAVCCGASCCLIEGTCYGTGDVNPVDPCLSCQPSESQAAWSPVAGCGGDAGPGPVDAGPITEPDAGSPEPDAGPTTPPRDAGTTPAMDAGTTPGTDAGAPVSRGGGCSVGARGAPSPALFALLALGLLARRRR